jgi:hypothetical protein
MGQSTIKDALARKKTQSPQYDYMWRVELPDLTTAPVETRGPYAQIQKSQFNSFIDKAVKFASSLSGLSAGGGMEEMNHRVNSIDTPFFQMETKKITNQNSFWYSASNNDIGSISMTIDEFEDGATYSYLNLWKSLIINEDGTYNPPNLYKKNIKLIRMSATNLDLHVFRYKGYFLNEVNNIQNSYEGNDITQYSTVFTGDAMEHIPVPPAEVKGRVAMAESSIMLQDWANDKFRMDGKSGADKVRIMADLSRIFT